MQVTSLDYSFILGRIAVGKVTRGSIKESQWDWSCTRKWQYP